MEQNIVFKMDSSNELVMESIQSMITSIDTLLKTTEKKDFTPKIMEKIRELENLMKSESSTTILTGENAKKMIKKITDFSNTRIVVPKEQTEEEKELIKTTKQTEVDIDRLGLSEKSVQKLKAKGFMKTDNVLDLVDKIYYEYPHEMEEVVIELLTMIEMIHPDAFRRYVQSTDETGDNLLMDTAIVKLEKMALYLLSKDRVDLNYQNKHGYTFLMYVCKNGWNQIFDRILPYVDILIKNEHHETALHYTIESKNTYMCEKLIQKMKDEDLFELTNHQNNALLSVARGAMEEISLSLIQRAPLLMYQVNKQNDTILHLACRHEMKKVLNEIFKHHFDKFDIDFINLRNHNGYTALDLMLPKKLKKEYQFMIHSGKLNDSIYEIYPKSKSRTYDQSFIGMMIVEKKEESLIQKCLKTIPYRRSDRINWLHYYCMLTLSHSSKATFAILFNELKENIRDLSFRIQTHTKTLLMILIEKEWYEFVEAVLDKENIVEYVSTLSQAEFMIPKSSGIEVIPSGIRNEDRKTALYIACEHERKHKTVIEKLLKNTDLRFYQNFDGIQHLQKCKKMVTSLHDKYLNQLFDEKIKEIEKEKTVLVEQSKSTSKYLFRDLTDHDFEVRSVNRRCSFTPRMEEFEIF